MEEVVLDNILSGFNEHIIKLIGCFIVSFRFGFTEYDKFIGDIGSLVAVGMPDKAQ
jgi:hypothetical protein